MPSREDILEQIHARIQVADPADDLVLVLRLLGRNHLGAADVY